MVQTRAFNSYVDAKEVLKNKRIKLRGFILLIIIGFSNCCYAQNCQLLFQNKPKKIRVVFHYVVDSTNSGNFTKKKDKNRMNGRKWSKQLVKKANEQLSSLHRNWKSPKGTLQPANAGFRYVLKKVKYISNNSYATIDSYTERSSNDINMEYGKKHHKMINIYFFQDYFKGMNNGGGITQRAKRPKEVFIKMYTFSWKKYVDYEGAEFVLREDAAVLNHEMGHLLGLDHDWLIDDGMIDTEPYKDRACESKKNKWQNCSNNFMTIPQPIPSLQGSFTACQITKMHEMLEGIRKIYVK